MCLEELEDVLGVSSAGCKALAVERLPVERRAAMESETGERAGQGSGAGSIEGANTAATGADLESRQDRTGQDGTRQDRTGQAKTGQDLRR